MRKRFERKKHCDKSGDINGDHVINSVDFSAMNTKWLTNDATSNKDGTVNSLDFSIMNGNWLKTY